MSQLTSIRGTPGFYVRIRAMGKGDRRTKRGKIFQGTTGKTRLKGKRKKSKAPQAEKKPA
jgi:ribosomal small subunit protein bTHX